MRLPRDVEYPTGVPRWFTYLAHRWCRRRCAKVGHTITIWNSCNHCGQKLGAEGKP